MSKNPKLPTRIKLFLSYNKNKKVNLVNTGIVSFTLDKDCLK